MGRVTQRVEPGPLAAELEQRGRAAVAFECAGRVEVLPARVMRRGGDIHGGDLVVGLVAGSVPDGAAFDRVTLILDDGTFWFELRAVNQRGRLEPTEVTPSGATPAEGLHWFVFDPARATAWDYSTLHEEPGE